MSGLTRGAYRSLRAHERRFVDALLAGATASAAIQSIPHGKRLRNPKDAAWRLRQRAIVKAAIAERSELLEVDKLLLAQRVVEEWSRIAFANPKQLFDEQGQLRPIHELEDEIASTIAAIEVEEGDPAKGKPRIRKYKMADKLKALHDLADWLRMVQAPVAPEPPPPLDLREAARRLAFVLHAGLVLEGEATPVLSGAVAPPEPLSSPPANQHQAGENP